MLQVHAKLNCDYGKKLNITGHFLKSYLSVCINTQRQKKKKNHKEGVTTYSKVRTPIIETI